MKLEFFFNVEHRLQYACRLARKAVATGRTLLAHCSDRQQLARFDAALWTFAPLEFVPHVVVESALAPVTPVLLATDGAQAPTRDVLLMLDEQVPADFGAWAQRWAHIVEVVSRDGPDRPQARERFRRYRELGYAPVSIDVGAAGSAA